jgi:hypothetical protein
MNKKITWIMVFLLITTLSPSIVYAYNENNNLFIKNLENFDMIIIAPSSYKPTLKALIQHKNNHNILTKFVSLNDIYSGTYFSVQGRDDQEKIKYFIKNAIESWGISFVLFVGSSDQIPIRFCYNNDNYSKYPELNFISELYYADIYDSEQNFSNWDSDEDDVFGEWINEVAEDKPIDLKPDVCLGRLACVNNQEVSVMVKKIINYEKRKADPSWFKKMIVVGGDTYAKFEGYEGEIYNQMALDAMPGFQPVKLWSSTKTLTKHGSSIIKAINRGAGFIYFTGHGNKRLWQTNYPNGSWVGRFAPINMLFLFNKNKLPICIVEGCHNSEFIGKTNNEQNNIFSPLGIKTKIQGCWSWVLTSRKLGGAISTIGPTGLCWYGAEYEGGGTNWLSIQLFKEYANGTETLGELWKNAITIFLENFIINWDTPAGGNHSLDAKTVQQWVLLGDPSLKIGGYN